jgi:hypothetical protein
MCTMYNCTHIPIETTVAVLTELEPPFPLPLASGVTPPEPRGGGAHSAAGEGVPIRTTGEKAWHSVYSVCQLMKSNNGADVGMGM